MGGHIPEQKVLKLALRYKLTTLIETGTWRGESAVWAAEHFERVYTIEANRKRFDGVTARLAGRHSNLTFVFGDSRVELARVLAQVREPCLFWLDAHWVGDVGAHDSQGDECPLLEELDAIGHWAWQTPSVILIDDARLFTAPPPYPHDPKQWASYPQIELILNRVPRTVYIDEDVIYAIPEGF